MLINSLIQAQPAYPPPPAAPANIHTIEWFTDKDPGFGNGTPLSFAGAADIPALLATISLTGIVPGVHRLFIRSQDNTGNWAITAALTFENFHPLYTAAPAPPVNLTKLEYFITNTALPAGSDPGFGNAASVLLPAAANSNNQLVIVNFGGALPPATRNVFVRVTDAAGNWSITNSGQFNNAVFAYAPAPLPPANISQLEVFFDNDPGFGNGFKQSVPAGTDISNFSFAVATDTLSQGTHHLYVRSLDNPWSMTSIVSFNKDVILPLTWLYVQATIVNDNTVVKWGTAQESNTRQFDVEHSTDGLLFTTIGNLPAAGNSATARAYQWIDPAPVPGLHYYRIKQTDNDGKYTYSAVVTTLYRNRLTKTIAAPNPAGKYVMLVFAVPATQSVLHLYNAAGQLVLTGKVDKGALQQSVDVSALPPGVYTLQMRHETNVETLRIVKQ